VGGLVLDPDANRVTIRGQAVEVTVLEFRLLHYLASHPNRLFSRARLLEAVWGEDHFVGPRIVDVYIRQLRKKLQPCGQKLLKTVRGAGYMFDLERP
jgi:two-component system phosphate regulon response regulator PhoB